MIRSELVLERDGIPFARGAGMMSLTLSLLFALFQRFWKLTLSKQEILEDDLMMPALILTSVHVIALNPYPPPYLPPWIVPANGRDEVEVELSSHHQIPVQQRSWESCLVRHHRPSGPCHSLRNSKNWSSPSPLRYKVRQKSKQKILI